MAGFVGNHPWGNIRNGNRYIWNGDGFILGNFRFLATRVASERWAILSGFIGNDWLGSLEIHLRFNLNWNRNWWRVLDTGLASERWAILSGFIGNNAWWNVRNGNWFIRNGNWFIPDLNCK